MGRGRPSNAGSSDSGGEQVESSGCCFAKGWVRQDHPGRTSCGSGGIRGEGPVGLIDVDPQGSLADWWNERTAPNPFFIQTAVPRLADDIRELAAHGLELLIIDTPPALTDRKSQRLN